MNIKKQLLTKIHQLPGNPSYMGVVDLILFKETLELLLPLYEVKIGNGMSFRVEVKDDR